MDRFNSISITNSSLGAHLFSNEEILTLTTNVGLYSGPYKSLPHSGGTIYLTTHRLFYIDDTKPHSYSCYLPLELIRETQYYAGFLKSSPKVTLLFSPEVEGERGEADGIIKRNSSSRSNGTRLSTSKDQDWRHGATPQDDLSSNLGALSSKIWICRICAFSNSLEMFGSTSSQDETVKCQLCGVTSNVKDLQLKDDKQSDLNPSSTNVKQSSKKLSVPSQSASDGINCSVCTFTNHPSMSRCEMCNNVLGTFETPTAMESRVEARKSGESLPSGAQTPAERDGTESMRHNSVRLSFRKGGDKAFYSTLKTTLKEKSWQKQSEGSRGNNRDRFSSIHRNIDGRTASSAFGEGNDSSNGAPRRVGIEGVFSAIDLSAKEDSEDMRDAFRDLEALMLRAKKMVDFAETLNAKLIRQEAAAKKTNGGDQSISKQNDEAANIIRTSLVRLGLPTPAITADMAKDEMEFNLQLAKELAGLLYTGPSPLLGRGKVLQKPLDEEERSRQGMLISSQTVKNGRGIIPLDELWCMWNRARGVALVSPKVLLNVGKILPSVTIPSIQCKTFQSGLRVVHTSSYQSEIFAKRVLKYIEAKYYDGNDKVNPAKEKDQIKRYSSGASTLEIAKREDCPLHLVNELLNEVEYETGSIVRDDQGEITWYPNYIVEFDWDQWKIHSTLTS